MVPSRHLLGAILPYLDANVQNNDALDTIRKTLRGKELILGGDGTWHSLQTCYWNSPSPIAGYLDLQGLYPDLQDFFTKKMRVKRVSPALLIKEVKKMSEHSDPQKKAIRDRLVEIGVMLVQSGFDASTELALNELSKVKFLPKRLTSGGLELVGMEDDFVIFDHVRYGQAFDGHDILLDFDVDEVPLLDVIFRKLGLTSRYLSNAIVEQSGVGDESLMNPTLSRQLQARAYALYCRRACYRSHLPRLLANITGSGSDAMFDISAIMSCEIDELDDILMERDIIDVSWIAKPTPNTNEPDTEELSAATEDPVEDVVGEIYSPVAADGVAVNIRSTSASLQSSIAPRPVTANNNHLRHDSVVAADEARATYAQQTQYRQLLERLIALAHGRTDENTGNPETGFAFGALGTDNFVYNRRIGAAGEAYVFEWLRALSLPHFTLDNWQSTIRGEVNIHPNYANVRDWSGRETTDLVYKDHTGDLTRRLRERCKGGFPVQIAIDHDHALRPVEYYLEVKSTPGQSRTRFYMSGSQYDRMEDMASGLAEGRMKVYVIMRVSNLTGSNVEMDVFVDPFRFKGNLLDFEAEQWFVKIQ
ncbi:hypothetical protein OPT61_g7958 [Boeremia exigua]|uniref:Uncharacterized protein n=1 Tax=Boeremia exigua TaxID=749465 RepID=A0ACC2I0H9_9PLEO|nr:hypothetical protein OPT61_g7958 [Boeremia exigua]